MPLGRDIPIQWIYSFTAELTSSTRIMYGSVVRYVLVFDKTLGEN